VPPRAAGCPAGGRLANEGGLGMSDARESVRQYEEVKGYVSGVVIPALQQVAGELSAKGASVAVSPSVTREAANLKVGAGAKWFLFTVWASWRDGEPRAAKLSWDGPRGDKGSVCCHLHTAGEISEAARAHFRQRGLWG